MVELLLDIPHIEVNQINLQSYTPLHYACAGNNTEITTMLLETGPAILTKDTFQFILPKASEVLDRLITKCPSEKSKKCLKQKTTMATSSTVSKRGSYSGKFQSNPKTAQL